LKLADAFVVVIIIVVVFDDVLFLLILIFSLEFDLIVVRLLQYRFQIFQNHHHLNCLFFGLKRIVHHIPNLFENKENNE